MSAYICLDLTPYVNNRGMTAITDYEKGTLSEGKSSFPMELLPTNKPFLIHDIPFAWSKTEEHDNIELTGQTLSFEATEVKEIYILGVSSNGDYFDQISFLHDGQEVCREYLYLSDFAATTASFRDRQALVTDYLHTRTGKYELVQPRMWLEQIPFASPCLINQIRLEDNPAMHIFAITLAGQKRGGALMEFTIYHNPYHNCRNMTVSAMVKRLGISLDYIWGQAGLSFKEEHQDITITPYYRSMESDFSQSHGIVTHEDNIADSYEFLHHLIGLVQANHTVAVMVDVFEMPYCIYYQLHHEIHDVEIVGMDGKHFVICDHYYHYYGTIETEQIRKAASASIDQLGFESCTAYYFTISRTSHFTYSEMDFTRVAAENYHVMSGKPIGFLKEQTRGLHIGLFALAPMKQRITEFLYANDQTDPGYLYNLYKMVKEVCNSRHHFHVFLQAFDQKELAFDYRVAAQHWGVIANLMVRAYLSKNYIGMAPRVELRFRKATEKETENTEKLQAMLM